MRWQRPDPVLALLAVVGLPAAVVYGAPLARNTTDVEDITNGVSHYRCRPRWRWRWWGSSRWPR